MAKVIRLVDRNPEQVLERLHRLTGLRFCGPPESLLHEPVSGGPAAGDAGPLPDHPAASARTTGQEKSRTAGSGRSRPLRTRR